MAEDLNAEMVPGGNRRLRESLLVTGTRDLCDNSEDLLFLWEGFMAEGYPDAGHPRVAELERLLLGDLPASQAAPLIAHLIRGCAECKAKMEPLAATVLGSVQPLTEPALDQDSQYDFPLFKAFASARRYARTMALEGSGAPEPRLREVPSPEALSQKQLAARDRSRIEALLQRCRALRSSDPEMMVLTAELAVSWAERLGAGTASDESTLDLQARAWAELGNAHRVADDFPSAESDMARAMAKAERGSGDPRLLARLMDLTASLYKDQRRFEEARRLLDLVYAICEREGDVEGEARALVSMGVSAGYAFEIEEAIHLLTRGIALLDGLRNPRLVSVAVHNLIWCLVEDGRPAQAHQLFLQSKALFARHAEPLEMVKSNWMEGRIAAALGDDACAEARFLEARARFDEVQLSYEVALVSLDLAALWLKAGRTAEIRELIDQTITIFQTRQIRREATGMLLVLREALWQERATEALLRTVASDLLRLEESPAPKSKARSS
jgi:tetratricopeptide (TPR) repeat protein